MHTFVLMRILDIGAGIRWVAPQNSDFDLQEHEGGMQEARFRWLKRNTAKQVRKLLGTKELHVSGLDLKTPPNFKSSGISFRGITIQKLENAKFDALTWFYPNPCQVVHFDTREKLTSNNPLDVVLKAVRENLNPKGLLIFETEMSLTRLEDERNTHQVLALIRQHLEAVLVPTDKEFHTNDPWRNFSCVYQKAS